MDRSGIEAIEGSLDLPIGTKFNFHDNLFEVAEFKEGIWGCPGCAFSTAKRNEEEMCDIMECTDSRRDGRTVCFKEVVKAEEEKVDEVTASEECCNREKTLIEEISELKIEESIKEKILKRITSLEKNNDDLVNTINRYYRSSRRLERTIVMLAAMVADSDESIMRDEVLRMSDIGAQDFYLPDIK